MQTLYHIVIVLHILCWTVVIGGWVATVRSPQGNPGMFHGAAGAVVTGLILVGLADGAGVATLNHVKIGIKLVLALIVCVLAFFAWRRGDKAPAWLVNTAGALAVVNVCIAVLWT